MLKNSQPYLHDTKSASLKAKTSPRDRLLEAISKSFRWPVASLAEPEFRFFTPAPRINKLVILSEECVFDLRVDAVFVPVSATFEPLQAVARAAVARGGESMMRRARFFGDLRDSEIRPVESRNMFPRFVFFHRAIEYDAALPRVAEAALVQQLRGCISRLINEELDTVAIPIPAFFGPSLPLLPGVLTFCRALRLFLERFLHGVKKIVLVFENAMARALTQRVLLRFFPREDFPIPPDLQCTVPDTCERPAAKVFYVENERVDEWGTPILTARPPNAFRLVKTPGLPPRATFVPLVRDIERIYKHIQECPPPISTQIDAAMCDTSINFNAMLDASRTQDLSDIADSGCVVEAEPLHLAMRTFALLVDRIPQGKHSLGRVVMYLLRLAPWNGYKSKISIMVVLNQGTARKPGKEWLKRIIRLAATYYPGRLHQICVIGGSQTHVQWIKDTFEQSLVSTDLVTEIVYFRDGEDAKSVLKFERMGFSDDFICSLPVEEK
eukprot:gnl/Chilomastix_cuspidata/4788.p1 GENE.gnl/Chilomastix_cuspidata/4788~~gnl/Chilomastix_cuspidata/4788.p1  ORF type:complete len:582 (+),score=164.95 gnl/Chilomastix_cuspidata/4788:256-1746(+)